jgi:hypothetical protein
MKYTLLIFLLLPTLLFGQSDVLSLSADCAFPNGSLKATAGIGIGVSARYERSIINRLTITGAVGYLSFAVKSITSTQPPIKITSKFSMIPIQVGARFFLFAKDRIQKGLFISGEIGVHVISANATVNGSDVGIPNETDLSFGPGLGYRLSSFEVSYRQQYIHNSGKSINFSNFGIAYVFKIKE